MVTLYSTGCPKCTVLKKKLMMSGLEFDTIEDQETVIAKAKELGLREAPFVIKDSEVITFADAMKLANSCDACKIGG